MAMARQRIEENPLYQAIVNARIANIVGRELRLKMSSGNDDWDTVVENWWKLEKDRLDVCGRRTWGDLCRLWQARRDIDGDVGIAMLDQTLGERPLSYVQTWEAENITKGSNAPADDAGIDFDEYGMPLRFYVVPKLDDVSAAPISYDRKNFILYVNDNTYRANRARGVSLFLQSFNIGQAHSDLMDGITELVKNATFIGLQFFRETDEHGNAFGTAGGETTGENGIDYASVKLLPGTVMVNQAGERAEVLEPKNPTTEVSNFEKKLISRMALPFGLTYELITGDYSAVNDRTMRVMLKQFEKHIRPEQAALGNVTSKIFRWTLSRAIEGGEIPAPPADLKTWFNHRWGAPGFPYINILQEANANAILLEKGLTSEIKILAEQGDDDLDEILDDIAYAQKARDKRGIKLVSSTPPPALPGSLDEPDAPPTTEQPTQ
jgi:capsid protein